MILWAAEHYVFTCVVVWFVVSAALELRDSRLESRAEKAEALVRTLKHKVAELEISADIWRKSAQIYQGRGGFGPDNPRTDEFSRDELKALIGLCHPDKHNNSPASNALTARLLALRNRS